MCSSDLLPVPITAEVQGNHYGTGIASSQPNTEDLLRETKGVADIATRAISNRLGSLNPQVKVGTRNEKGTIDAEVLDDHVLKVLLDKPHPDFTRQQMFRLVGQWVVTTGDAYWLKIRNGLQVPTMLQPLPPTVVEPVIKGGFVSSYAIRDGNGQTVHVPATEIIRFWFPDPETVYTGEGYLAPNAVVHDAQAFAQEHLRSRYQNDAIPPAILKGSADAVAPNDPQWERWQKDFQRKYNNRDGSHRGLPSQLPPGWDMLMTQVASGADITPLLEFWQSNMLMNFGVPPSILGRVISGDRSAAETNQYVFDKHTILPIAEMIQQALTLQLAPDYDAALWVEFEKFISDDKDYELKREDQDLRLKTRSVQQVIEERGGDPEQAPWGADPVGTMADTPYTGERIEESEPAPTEEAGALFEDEDAEEEVPDDAESPDEPRSVSSRVRQLRAGYFSPAAEWARVKNREKTFKKRMERGLRSVIESQRVETIKRLRKVMRSHARASVKVEKIFLPKDWKKAFAARVEPVRRAAYLASAGEAMTGIGLGQEFVMNEVVVETLKTQAGSLVKNTGLTTQRKLRKTLAAGVKAGESQSKMISRVNKVFKDRRGNAATIARTEVHNATQNAQLESFDQSGVVERKEWNDFGDNEVRDSHWDAYIEPANLRDPFILSNGAVAMYPGDPSLDPEDVINCRCFVTPLFEDEE